MDDFTHLDKSPAFTPERRGNALWTQHENRRTQGSFLTSIGQIQEYERRRVLRALMPSGHLHCGDRTIKGRGASDLRLGDLVVGDTTDDTGSFYIYAPDDRYVVHVNGWLITLYNVLANGASASAAPDDDYITIHLNQAPSSGHRFDLVFLEVWRTEIGSTDTVPAWGSVDSGETAFTNDIIDSRVSYGAVNSAVEIRSRIRVVDNVDYAAHPVGLSDTARVKAWGGATADTSHTFANMGSTTGDYGLWRAGGGGQSDRGDLDSTDGYSYAVPIAIVSRRNRTRFNANSNRNGVVEPLGTTTLRPDGLHHDQVAARDIDDLRQHTSVDADYAALTRAGRDRVMRNTGRFALRQQGQAGVWGNELLHNYTLTNNGGRRRYSNEAGDQQVCTEFLITSDRTVMDGVLTFTWATRTITIDANANSNGVFPTGTIVKDEAPTLLWENTGLPVVMGAWTGLGTATASAVVDNTGSGFERLGRLGIVATLTLPAAAALPHVPTTLHEAELGGSDIVVVDRPEDLNLTNLTRNDQWGVCIDPHTRGVTEYARRIGGNIFNQAGIAYLDAGQGPPLDATRGTVNGPFITGGTSGTAVDVVTAIAPSASAGLSLWYSYRPPMMPLLPSSLGVRILYMEPTIYSSNLGTGGGTPGQPYRTPLLHIPEQGTGTDRDLNNSAAMGVSGFVHNLGFLSLPVLWSSPWDLITVLRDGETDAEGRSFYAQADGTYAAHAANLTASQRHRTVQFGVARVESGSGSLPTGELALLAFTSTADDGFNKVAIDTSDTAYAVAAYPLREVTYV